MSKPPKSRRATRAEIERLFPHMPKPSQVKTFHAAMGRAIATWQDVEGAIYEVYRATTGAQRPGAEACAFYSVPAFRAKLNMTTAAVQFALLSKAADFSAWKALAERAAKKSDRRNDIAHGAVWITFQETRRERKIYIGPNAADIRESARRKSGSDTDPLTLRRLHGYEVDFRLLAKEIRDFVRRIPPP
jgi:hypothetical protein